jgi:hypothetical protein
MGFEDIRNVLTGKNTFFKRNLYPFFVVVVVCVA